MKIEKISDNQIRCTLNQADLTSRQLKISELAYGSSKAKALFKDMMKQASYECGFEADDMPLMIEAIPVSADCIVIIVTKVDDPEELDTRFSKFTSTDTDDEYDYPFDDEADTLSTIPEDFDSDKYEALSASEELDIPDEDAAGDVINLFNKVKEFLNKSISDISDNPSITPNDSNNSSKSADFVPLKDSISGSTAKQSPVIRIYSFDNFETFSDAAIAVSTTYSDRNTLYKCSKSSTYYLVLYKTVCQSVDFNKTCNILSEFGSKENANTARVNYFDEHLDCIIRDQAIQVAAKL